MTPSDYERAGRALERLRLVVLADKSVTAMLRKRVEWCNKEGVPTGWLEFFVNEWDKVEKFITEPSHSGDGGAE